MSYPNALITEAVVIAAGASLSGASTKHAGYTLVGVQTATTWDAAKISLAGSVDGTNFFTVRDKTAEYEIAAVTGAAYVAIDPAITHMCRYFKVRSGTSGAETAQADATIVRLVFKAI